MKFITSQIRAIMIIVGALNVPLFAALIYPHEVLTLIFGESVFGPLAELIARHWGVLAGSIGIMLIFGALNPHARRIVVAVATIAKLSFLGLFLSLGDSYLSELAVPMTIESISVIIFIVYLIGVSKR